MLGARLPSSARGELPSGTAAACVDPQIRLGKRRVVENPTQNMNEEERRHDHDDEADREPQLGSNLQPSQTVMSAVRHRPEEEEGRGGDQQEKEFRQKESGRVPGHASATVPEACPAVTCWRARCSGGGAERRLD